MAQYQSFPDAVGDSRTLDKLRALRLPDLKDRIFLDVGCNEGFFCGFAQYAGARRAVGLDKSRLFLDRAQRRYPECEFVLGEWDALPTGPFDVVLLASAIHYAEDQPDLIRRLVDLLTHDGVLVIEMGLVSSAKSEWRRVKRGDDERMFPSMKMLEEVLAPYAWKWMGPSVDQAGDPVKRHVIHVMRRRPVAYLLMQPPGYGKTTIAAGLFKKAGVVRVSGDELVLQVARQQLAAPSALYRLLAKDFSPFRIDASIRKIFDAGQGAALVKVFADAAGGGDFALDAYVPEGCHAEVEKCVADAGYLPVRLHWERAGLAPLAPAHLTELAESYFKSLAGRTALAVDRPPGRGYVDTIEVGGPGVVVTGWAVDGRQQAGPAAIDLWLGEQRYRGEVSVVSRRDVQRRLGLAHERFGYRATVELPAAMTVLELLQQVRVSAVWADAVEVPLRFSTSLEQMAGVRGQ